MTWHRCGTVRSGGGSGINEIQLNATLQIGETILTFTNNNITDDVLVDYYSEPFGISPTNAVIENHTLTLTFEPQEIAVSITVTIKGKNVTPSPEPEPEPTTLTFLVEGAKEDSITIYNSDNEVVGNVIMTSGETSKEVTLTIDEGSQYTFTSSVAKAIDGSGANYSKVVSLSADTTRVKVMPDKSLYWYGNECEDLTGGWTRDGYEFSSGWTGSVTKETNYVTLSSTNQYSIIGTANKVNMDDVSKAYININVVSLGRASENWFAFAYAPDEKTGSPIGLSKKTDLTTGNHILNFDATSGNHYIETYMRGGGYSFNYRVNAVWLE